MKKSLIAVAGASAIATVGLPMACVFADPVTTVTDQLTVTVSESCTMADVSPAAAASTYNAYTASGTSGELLTFTSASGATSFTVQCNDQDGYTITPTFTALKLGDHAGDADAGDIAYGTAAANAQQWTAYYTKNSAAEPAAFANGTAVEGDAGSDTYEFSYKVGLGAAQAEGNYVGTAQYVLAGVTP